MKGKTLEEAKRMKDFFKKMLLGDEIPEEQLGVAFALKDVSRMPARVKCAELAWKVF